jgi:hypothetical protein
LYIRQTQISALNDICRRRALCSIDHIEADALTLLERLEPVGLDSGMMHKDILATILLDKTETFRIIKPFYSSFSHCHYSLFFFIVRTFRTVGGRPRFGAIGTTLHDRKDHAVLCVTLPFQASPGTPGYTEDACGVRTFVPRLRLCSSFRLPVR